MSDVYPVARGSWVTLDSRQVYENAWINVQHQNVLTPTGTRGLYGLVHFRHVAVGIVPIDDDGNTWLVRQFRYPLNEYSWEIPEGGAPEHESYLESAQRELREETGLIAEQWKEILTLHTSNSVTDEVAIIYLAQQLSECAASPEASEDIEVRKMPFAEAVAMVMRGDITDAMSVAAILKIHCQFSDIVSTQRMNF